MAIVAIGLAGGVSEAIRPPMHRAWTYVSGERTEVLAVRNGVIYFTSRQRTGALKLSDGSVVWEKKRPDWAMQSVIDDKRIIVSTSSMEQGRLIAYDLTDGKERVIRNLPERAHSFALWKNQICLLLPGRKVTAFDADSGKVAWEATVGDGTARGGVSLDDLYVCSDVLVMALDDIGWQCLDLSTGKSLWKIAADYATNSQPVSIGGRVLLEQPVLALVEARTGKEVWSDAALNLEMFGFSGDVLIGESNDKIVGLDLKRGSTLWTLPEGEEGFRGGFGAIRWQGDEEGVAAWSNEFMRISQDGTIVWRSPVFFDGYPVHMDDGTMVTSDGDRLLCYTPGPYPQVPQGDEGRKAFAERGVAVFELLDHTEVEQIKGLGQYATEPLIRRYVEWAKAQQAAYDDEDSDSELGMLHYSLLQTTAQMLGEMCGPEHSAALQKAIEDVGPENSYRDYLVSILGSKGDPDEFIEHYIRELRASKGDEEAERRNRQTLQSVANSNHKSAVAFMIEALNDPTSPDDWRHEAFVNLPRTGGEAGIAAVRSARKKRAPRQKWEETIDVAGVPEGYLVSERTDAKGRTWRLFRSGALGSWGDLFISQKTGGSWGVPVFTGIFTRDTWTTKAPTQVNGVPMEEFMESKWIEVLPDDAALRADGDGDGLTDLAEKRLGTDPTRKDTDEDGLGDAVDPCPNAAPRALGDTEKIIEAALEARFFAQGWSSPALVGLDGMVPFEMYGYAGRLLWQTKGYAGDLPNMYNTGMNMLSFRATSTTVVTIAADGKSAYTLISRYSGGLNGDGIGVNLTKVGDEWFVVRMRMEYVS